ncbi:hypothetical protein GCM10028806_54720 [Spirosoma terrae]|uniref:Uncharacterized protein n=1 Tax=Spirosoma terrae TaxID=1968276 RepID=A0A6L9LB46_9BACT|nr:hypothetical protein [Spirosoma terrae]NDU96727.1 hypothetical protein [Spirosoma terrae]
MTTYTLLYVLIGVGYASTIDFILHKTHIRFNSKFIYTALTWGPILLVALFSITYIAAKRYIDEWQLTHKERPINTRAINQHDSDFYTAQSA